MKAKHFLIISIIATIFLACDPPTSYSTPGFRFAGVVSNGDSLRATSDGLNIFRLDTIRVGDIVTFNLILDGVYNNLTTFNMTLSDSTAARLILPDAVDLDGVFSNSLSDYKHGKFVFNLKTNFLPFPFSYEALKAGNTAAITFSVASDAVFPKNSTFSNSSTFKLKTPIVNRSN